MSDSFNIEQELTLTEFLSVTYYTVSKMKIVRRIFLFTCGIGVFNGIMNFAVPGQASMEWRTIIFQFLFLPFFILLFFFVLITIIGSLMMLIKPGAFKNISYHFTHWGMEKTAGEVFFSLQWNKFLKFKITKNFILLYLSENDVQIIQKRKFHSDKEMNDFLALVAKKIANN